MSKRKTKNEVRKTSGGNTKLSAIYDNVVDAVEGINQFSAIKQNIIFTSLSLMKNRGTEVAFFEFDKLREIMGGSYNSNEEFGKELETTLKELVKLNYTRTKLGTKKNKKGENKVESVEIFMLYSRLVIDYENQLVEIQVSEHFEYVLNELMTARGYTKFSLQEFISLRSRYSKGIFRLLRKYTSGWAQIKVEDFRSIYGVPESYEINHITSKILDPAIEELSPLFNNLRYEKIKRGNKVTSIKFMYDSKSKKQTKIDEAYTSAKMKLYTHRLTLEDLTVEELEAWEFYKNLEVVDNHTKAYNEDEVWSIPEDQIPELNLPDIEDPPQYEGYESYDVSMIDNSVETRENEISERERNEHLYGGKTFFEFMIDKWAEESKDLENDTERRRPKGEYVTLGSLFDDSDY